MKMPYFSAGTLVEMAAYEPKADAFLVIDVRHPAMGPFYGKVDDILKATSALNSKKVRQNPSLALGQQFQLDRNVKVLVLEAVKEKAK